MASQHGLRVVTESVELDGAVWVLLRVYGNSIGAGIEVLESALDSCISQPPCRVQVRFEDATVVSSLTFGVLVGAAGRARSHGGRLKVWFPPDLVRRYRGLFAFGDEDGDTGILGVLPKRPGPTQATDAKRPEEEAG